MSESQAKPSRRGFMLGAAVAGAATAAVATLPKVAAPEPAEPDGCAPARPSGAGSGRSRRNESGVWMSACMGTNILRRPNRFVA